MISTSELTQFKESNNIKLGQTRCVNGRIWVVVAGTWNLACPFECMCISELLLIANEGAK